MKSFKLTAILALGALVSIVISPGATQAESANVELRLKDMV